MAKADDTKKQEDPKAEKSDESPQAGTGGGILQWVIMAVVVALLSGTGFVLGRLFASPDASGTTQSSQEAEPAKPEYLKADGPATDSQKTWYYDLEPVVANLNVPGATRYVRTAITLEINSEVDEKEGIVFLEKKKPVLTNWLTIYLASLSIEDIRGDRNLQRIQLQILDAFNEKLFPDAKPQIKYILFKEFAIQ